MKFKRNMLIFLIFFMTIFSLTAEEKRAKYIFYFIGDGMGAAQRQLAEYYLESINSDNFSSEGFRLRMNRFPVAAIYASHSASSLVTDSAAGGTALACSVKTDNGMIGMRPDGTPVNSIAVAARNNGLAVGLVTSTRITHATPASFYGHNLSRDNENEIALDLVESGFDFFAGGGYRHFIPDGSSVGKSKRKDGVDLLAKLSGKGYRVYAGESQVDAFLNWAPSKNDRCFASLTYTHLPMELDRIVDKKTPSLSQLTSKAIDLLSLDDEGFFLMVEGGRIDHACHANDPAGAVFDVLAFDQAIEEAWNFYKKYPDETLIVVAADHETGGIGLGFGMNYFLELKKLQSAKGALTDQVCENDPYQAGMSHGDYLNKLLYLAGFESFTAKETAQLESMMNAVDANPDYGKGLFGYYDPVSMTIASIVSERAGLQWTTYAHTGTQLPLSAVGAGSETFGGFYDNTQIPQRIMMAAGISFSP